MTRPEDSFPGEREEITLETALIRLQDMEQKFNWALSALDLMGSLTQFQTVVNQGENIELVLSETRSRIEQILSLRAIAFYMVDPEDASFQLAQCIPVTSKEEVQRLADEQIVDGMFAWAVQQNRPVNCAVNDGNETLILHSITTPKRVIGMFTGIFAGKNELLTNISLRMLTMILSSAASAIESHTLTKLIQDQNENLENIVKMRTRQLERAREDAEQANRAKSSFLANMSHELRTPLNAILGYAEIMAEDAEEAGNGDLKDDLGKIFSAGNHLLALINDLLDLSKIEAGRLEIEWTQSSVEELLGHVRTIAPPLVEKRNNNLIIENTSDVDLFFVDSLRLRQSISNLISNACKFTKNGTITFRIFSEHKDNRDWICFSVTDSGIGIQADKVNLIFNAFAQAEASTTREYGGTGLGLTITKRLCNMMGGDITVESELNQGATFTITLPLFTKVPGSDMTMDSD